MLNNKGQKVQGGSVAAIVQEADVVRRFQVLGNTLLPGGAFIRVPRGHVGALNTEASYPPAVVKAITAYVALTHYLQRLEAKEPAVARLAAKQLVTRLTAFCQRYYPVSEARQGSTGSPGNPFVERDVLEQTSASQLLKDANKELKQLLQPVIRLHPLATFALVASTVLMSTLVLLVCSMAVMAVVFAAVPGMTAWFNHFHLPIAFGHSLSVAGHLRLFTLPNVLSAIVGALCGSSLGFFMVNKIEQRRWRVLENCFKAIKTLQKTMDATQKVEQNGIELPGLRIQCESTPWHDNSVQARVQAIEAAEQKQRFSGFRQRLSSNEEGDPLRSTSPYWDPKHPYGDVQKASEVVGQDDGSQPVTPKKQGGCTIH
jgi:hypothetical protein